MADPTQVVQYQTGLPPEAALYGQQLLGQAAGLIYEYEKTIDPVTKKEVPLMVDPKTGQPTTDGTGIPKIKGFQPYQQYTGDRVAQFTPLQQQAFQAAQTLGVDPATAAAARGLQSLAQSAAGTSYKAFTGEGPSMTGPKDVTTQGLTGATVNFAGYDPFTGTSPLMQGPDASITNAGVISGYMSPYMQNVVDVQQQQAKRQAAIAQQSLAAQAARAGAFGGSGAALQRAQANAQLQRDLQGIQATGLQSAYQQGVQQFNVEQAAKQQAAIQNLQARLQTQALGEQSRQYGAGLGLQAATTNAQLAQQAAIQSEANRLQAQGMNQQAALATAQANLQARLQTQQLAEQSRQFGAGLGLQGLQTSIQGMQAAGQMGQTAFGQQQAAIGLQNQMGTQQQQQMQNILNQQYQDFQNAQNLPYKQLGFMSDMIRGLPMSQTSSTMYQAPPSNAAVLTGLTGAALTGGMFKSASGGVVSSYADGGSVFSRENKEKIVGDMHPMGLPRAMQGAMMRGDMDTYAAAQSNMAEDDAIRRGIAAFAPQDIGVGYARGGIVAFANGGTKDEEEATSTAGNIWRSITGAIKGGIEKTARAGELRQQMEEARPGFFEALTPTQRAERQAQGRQLREEYDRLLGRTPAAPKMTAYDSDVAERADRMTGSTETAAPTEKKAAPKIAPQINTALNKMSEQSGVPKETLLDSYTALRAKIEKEGEPDRKEYMEMMKSFLGEGKKVREGATQKALQEFFLNMAAQGAQPGVARGRGLGQILQPAGAAAPSYMKSLNESEKIAREMDSNDQKMMLLGKQFEMSQKAGDRKTALEMAMNMETIKRQQEQLQLERDKLNQLVSYQDRYLGVLSQKAAGSSGLQRAYLTGLSRADDRASRIAKDNWGKIDVRQDLKKQGFQTFDQYYDYVAAKERRKAVPIHGVTPASEKDDDLED